MIWSLEDINRARRAYAKFDMDRRYEHDSYALGRVRREMQKKIVALIVRFGLDAHPDDVMMKKLQPYDNEVHTDAIRLLARWEPEVRDYRIVGGPHDGTVYILPKGCNPLADVRMPAPPEDPWYFAPHFIPSPQAIVMPLMGWHEQDRLWLYRYPTLKI